MRHHHVYENLRLAVVWAVLALTTFDEEPAFDFSD